jgi:hypothetical protein
VLTNHGVVTMHGHTFNQRQLLVPVHVYREHTAVNTGWVVMQLVVTFGQAVAAEQLCLMVVAAGVAGVPAV